MHKTTLEQWSLLDKVMKEGSFAKAADLTNRSQSSVSYNLAMLQQRIGITLLHIEGRKAVLTPAGELLLAQVRPLLKAFHSLEAYAGAIRSGVRTKLDLVVDSIFPRRRLFAVLKTFQQRHPHTQINLTEVLETDTDYAEADVMVVTQRQDMAGRGEWLMNVDFVAVAHRDHPLHQCGVDLDEEQLARYPLIRIADREHFTVQNESSSGDYWSFSTIDAAVEAVMHQVGYGWIPQARIRHELAQGILKILPLRHGVRRATTLHLLIKKDIIMLDPPIATLLDLLKTAPQTYVP
ncbi:LysR family transcriptional regulator [Pantoea stewartii]|uniref:LysR family transcriptional regulator n=1 Tax=Pantoea stewartii TaxID=66269 RepID=UPI0025A28FA7|nr:LysR family transcriptional regulator [Pantoea stewartii]